MNPAGYTAVVPRPARKNQPTEWSKWAVAARAATGLSQTDFGAKIGKSKGTVTDWERAENGLDLESVAKILEKFPGVPPPPIRLPGQPSKITEVSDPSGKVPAEHNAGAYTVKTHEGTIIAGRLDDVLPGLDQATRYKLMQKCLGLIDAAETQRHPSKLGAG